MVRPSSLLKYIQSSTNPTADDVLRARLKTVGVSEYKFQMEAGTESGTEWKIIDVGGSRSQVSLRFPFFINHYNYHYTSLVPCVPFFYFYPLHSSSPLIWTALRFPVPRCPGFSRLPLHAVTMSPPVNVIRLHSVAFPRRWAGATTPLTSAAGCAIRVMRWMV